MSETGKIRKRRKPYGIIASAASRERAADVVLSGSRPIIQPRRELPVICSSPEHRLAPAASLRLFASRGAGRESAIASEVSDSYRRPEALARQGARAPHHHGSLGHPARRRPPVLPQRRRSRPASCLAFSRCSHSSPTVPHRVLTATLTWLVGAHAAHVALLTIERDYRGLPLKWSGSRAEPMASGILRTTA
ncbi:hypothetical protein CDEF62S_00494 [Castellaniella defragrans]